MKAAVFIIGLVLICYEFTGKATTEGQLEGFAETAVQSECRDRYLWIHVASTQTPRFEAVDGDGVHFISEQIASRCGYTVSTLEMDGFTTFRASYYSCFTHNQNDEVFSFRFNLMLSDAGGGWISRPVSAVCSALILTHREVICEEDYMEVNVNRESSCGGQVGSSGPMWQAAFSQAQRMATSVWQLMILQSDGQVFTMSIREAERQGYSLTSTTQRMVLRSQYKQPHTELTMVDGVLMEVVRASLFYKQKLMVVMIDMSIACTVNSGSFDGAWLLWEIPQVVTPLTGEGAGFESQSLRLGVDGVLLEEPTAARGYSLVQHGALIQIGIPFGAKGGYRKSLVVNNMYKETYAISLLYEHVFTLLYEDGSSIDTRHRMFRVLETPPLCRPPFSVNQTRDHEQMFRVYLGNIPADVLLEEVWINGQRLLTSGGPERGYSIGPVVHLNGSRAYELQLPFENVVVHRMYRGHGVVQYSIDVNFTLTITTQRDSYHHHTFITAQVSNAFPPEITAQCSDRGITFSIVRLPQTESLWEVGIDHEPLTSQLVAQRGYRLHNDSHRTTLEVPVFSVGYSYEDINLSNFYGTFKLLLRDSKTLEIQTSTSKRCLFKTQDMIVCAADGTATVVTTPTSTWPTVQPERTTLLDPTCGPKQTDAYRVLFEFKLDSCGTRAMVGELYLVYENEIIHDRLMMTDGPNLISRESQFKLTVRCFYPLNGVNRLSLDRILRTGTPGFGSVKVFKSIKDNANELSDQDCLHKVPRNPPNPQADQVYQAPAAEVLPQSGNRPQPKPGAGHFVTVPASQNPGTIPNFILSPPEGSTTGTHKILLYPFTSDPGPLMSQTPDQHVFSSQNSKYLPNFPPRYDQIPDSYAQLSNVNKQSYRDTNPGLTDGNPASFFSSSNKIPESPVVKQVQSDLGSSTQTATLQGLNSVGAGIWHSGTSPDQPTFSQNVIIDPNQDPKSPQVDLFTGVQELTQQHEASLDLSLNGPTGSGMDMAKTVEIQGRQPQSQYDSFQTAQLHPVLQPPAQYSPDNTGSSGLLLLGGDNSHIPAKTGHFPSQNTVTDVSVDTHGSLSTGPTSTETSQANQNLKKTGSVERRNIETVQSRVQNIRVKPLSQFVPHGHLSQKLYVQQINTQGSNPSQYATGPVRVKSDQTAVVHLTDLSRNQQTHEQKRVQPVAEKGNGEGRASASTQRTVLKPTESHIRVRLKPGLSGRLQTHYEPKPQNPDTRGGTSRTSNPEPPQSIPNTSGHSREYQLNSFNSNTGSYPTTGGAGFTGSHKGPKGSSSTSSDLNIHTTADCSGPFGASIHRGIMRGGEKLMPYTP